MLGRVRERQSRDMAGYARGNIEHGMRTAPDRGDHGGRRGAEENEGKLDERGRWLVQFCAIRAEQRSEEGRGEQRELCERLRGGLAQHFDSCRFT